MSLMSLALAFHARQREAWRRNVAVQPPLKLEMPALLLFCVKNANYMCKVDARDWNQKSYY